MMVTAFSRPLRVLLPATLFAGAAAWFSLQAGATQEPPAKQPIAAIDFNRQIRPILSENCFTCHGPDEQQRKAKLRLDTRDGLFGKLRGGGHAVVPGKPSRERAGRAHPQHRRRRTHAAGQNREAAHAAANRAAQAAGSHKEPYAQHWAFVPPQRPDSCRSSRPTAGRAMPSTTSSWPASKKKDLRPSPEAERITLIRRVTLDLTGLPPTPAEVDAFLADPVADAYEKVVDRLLASPHYGERMAVDWLDAARYADTHGYHIDAGRDMSLLARMGDRRFQHQHAVRPVHDRATCRRSAAECDGRAENRHRLQPQPHDQLRGRRDSGGIPQRLHRRPRQHHGDGTGSA